MGDLISRQAALKWCRPEEWGTPDERWRTEGEFGAMLEALPSAQQWIPVTERLPNSNGCYLVWRPHFFGGEKGMPAICYFDGQNVWHDSYGVDFERVLHPDDVTAWMPLPPIFREEGKDD